MKMILGTDFIFETNKILPNKRSRSTSQSISAQSRISQRSVLQHLGPASDEITLSGSIFPDQLGTADSMDELRALADVGESHTLIDDQGEIHGRWMISSISENSTVFDNQSRPKKIEFSVQLKRQA